MKNTLSNVLIFAAGAAVGGIVAWRILKPYYEKLARAEIDAVVDDFCARYEDNIPETKREPEQTEEPHEHIANVIKELGYTNEVADKEEGRPPYVISPDDFGEMGYEEVTLYYYANGILTTQHNTPIEEFDHLIGEDSLNHFGEYEDDSVHVRNERLKIDYEILFDTREYEGE